MQRDPQERRRAMGQGRRGDKTDSDSDREPEPIEFAMQMSYDGYCKSYKQLREHRRELQRSFADQIQLSKAQRKRLIVKAEAAFQGIEKDGRQYLQWYLELERQDRPRKWYDYRKAKRDIEMVREFDAAIKDPEKVQQKTWSEVSSDHTITHDGSFHGSRISEIGFTGREDAERAYAHAKAEREARIAMYFADREKRQALEAARQAGDTPSRPPSAPPSDQTIQDCLTGAAQTETREADNSDQQPNPETSPQQANTELEAESQPLLDLGEEVSDRIEEVEIEDIGSHTVSDRNSLVWDDDQDLQSEEPESTPDPIPAQGQDPEKQSPLQRAAQICKILMGTDYVRLILEFKGDIDDAKDRQLMHLAIAECSKQGINAVKYLPAIETFINKINVAVANEAVLSRSRQLPKIPDANDPKPVTNPRSNPEPAKKPDPKPSQSAPLTEEAVNHFLETGESLVFNNSNGNAAGVGTIEDLGRVLNTRTNAPTSTANVTTTANLGARPKVMTSAPASTTASLRSHRPPHYRI
jgi:hypothetical protein